LHQSQRLFGDTPKRLSAVASRRASFRDITRGRQCGHRRAIIGRYRDGVA
jgi:hypothetical protein